MSTVFWALAAGAVFVPAGVYATDKEPLKGAVAVPAAAGKRAMNGIAPKPSLREEVSLNGTWPEGGAVPQYTGIPNFDRQTFDRQVMVPAAWAGKVIKVEFGAVNFVANVYINNQLVQNHVGGWNPFAVDVTGRVTPGNPFALKVEVRGPRHAPISDAQGKFVWPVGNWSKKGGIADDVWLRAYGSVHIEDAFVQTSFRDKTLAIDYTLNNTDAKPRTVTLHAEAARANNGAVEKALETTVTLAANERKVVRVREAWTNPDLYWPDRPTLYHLRSTLRENGNEVDTETRRFGFREIWIDGNQFVWNGIRINLYGDYQSINGGYHTTASDITPGGWPGTVDKIKAMNIRCLRWHHNPVPQYLLDVADEKGLLICSESANYAREFLMGVDQEAYVANNKRWVEAWIKKERNHPSIYLWSATNEMTYINLGAFKPEHCRAIGDAIRLYDTTRPVGYDGDAQGDRKQNYGKVDNVCLNLHYPEGYNKEPTGSIYGWSQWVHATKPTGTGEMLHTRDGSHPELADNLDRNKWWLGMWTRGLRYTNWTDVRPSTYWFAAKDLESPDPKQQQRGINLRNAYAPVALFDKAYDDLGIAPYVTGNTPGGTLPTVQAGESLERTLVLYNDEFRDTIVEIEVSIVSGDKTLASARKTFDVGLGEHVDIPCTFAVPDTDGQEMQLVLRTFKNNEKKFDEARRFSVTGAIGDSKTTITIGDAK